MFKVIHQPFMFRTFHKAAYVMVTLFLLGGISHAGLPQPGIVLYGKVQTGTTILTDGDLSWTYTPANGGPSLTIHASLDELPGPNGGTISYTILIPTELQIDGYPPDPGMIQIYNDQQSKFTRSAKLDGQQLVINNSKLGETFNLNAIDNIGFVERVDLILPDPDSCCPGDADLNLFVNLDDYSTVRLNFGDPSPELGDANCSGFVNTQDYASVRDNFGHQCGGNAPNLLPIDLVDGVGASVTTGSNASHVKAAQAVIQSSASQINIGDKIEISVAINAAGQHGNLAGIFLQYDPTLIHFIGGEPNRTVFDNPLFTGIPTEVAPGLIAYSVGSESELPGEYVKTATLMFEAVSYGTAKLVFPTGSSINTRLQNSDFEDLPLATQQGSFLIVDPATLEPPSNIEDYLKY